jgi:hypothetical protein
LLRSGCDRDVCDYGSSPCLCPAVWTRSIEIAQVPGILKRRTIGVALWHQNRRRPKGDGGMMLSNRRTS